MSDPKDSDAEEAPNDEVLTPGNVGMDRLTDDSDKDSDSAVASEENSTNPE